MIRLGKSMRSFLVVVLFALALAPACSTQGPRQTQEQQESVDRPTRAGSTAKEKLETAGQATLVVLVVGAAIAIAALPIVLLVVLL